MFFRLSTKCHKALQTMGFGLRNTFGRDLGSETLLAGIWAPKHFWSGFGLRNTFGRDLGSETLLAGIWAPKHFWQVWAIRVTLRHIWQGWTLPKLLARMWAPKFLAEMGLAVVRNLWQGWGRRRRSEIFGRDGGSGGLKFLARMGAAAAVVQNFWQGWGRGRDVWRRSGQSGGLGEGEEVKLFFVRDEGGPKMFFNSNIGKRQQYTKLILF